MAADMSRAVVQPPRVVPAITAVYIYYGCGCFSPPPAPSRVVRHFSARRRRPGISPDEAFLSATNINVACTDAVGSTADQTGRTFEAEEGHRGRGTCFLHRVPVYPAACVH